MCGGGSSIWQAASGLRRSRTGSVPAVTWLWLSVQSEDVPTLEGGCRASLLGCLASLMGTAGEKVLARMGMWVIQGSWRLAPQQTSPAWIALMGKEQQWGCRVGGLHAVRSGEQGLLYSSALSAWVSAVEMRHIFYSSSFQHSLPGACHKRGGGFSFGWLAIKL